MAATNAMPQALSTSAVPGALLGALAMRCVITMQLVVVAAEMHSGFAAPSPAPDQGNYLCLDHWGDAGVGYPLPCKAPREDWQAPLSKEFVITAWWPPTMNHIDAYKAAGFNLVLGGNIVSGCQYNGTTPAHPTMDEAFECVAAQLLKMHKLGLYFAFGIGHISPPANSSAKVLGGAASFGGVTESAQPGGYPTAPEVEWVVSQLRDKNLSHVVAQYFLHDDDAAASGAVARSVQWLHDHAPEIMPQTNTFPDSGPSALYRTRQPIFAAEEYAITGTTGNATAETNNELVYFANNEMIADRYRLDTWPLFALGDGGDVPVINSDSLVRVQVFAAIAYGARGLYYYCWGHGIWNMPHPSQVSGRGTPTLNYEDVAKANKDAKVWGQRLLGKRRFGTFRTAPESAVTSARAVPPRMGLIIEAMSEGLLVVVFAENSTDLLLMVVDTRTSHVRGAVPVRKAFIQVAVSPCGGTSTGTSTGTNTSTGSMVFTLAPVPGGTGGYAEGRGRAAVTNVGTSRVEFDIEGGGGLLLSVADTVGSGCLVDTAAKTRDWFFNPSHMSLRWSYPKVSPKTASFSAWGGPPRAYKAGGLAAGMYSSFMIGGDMHSDGFGFGSTSLADAWAGAGFNVVSLPGANTGAVTDGLGWAARAGMFVVLVDAASGACDGTMSPSTVEVLARTFSCHTNLLGLNLALPSDGAQPRPNEAADASRAMKNAFYWGYPFALVSTSVKNTLALAEEGIPLAPMAFPSPSANATTAAALHDWAMGMVQHVANLTAIAHRRGSAARGNLHQASKGKAQFTPAVMFDACSANRSDSVTRFQAFASVLYGAQGVWWRHMDTCAKVNSPQFGLISAINRRIASWADPLLLQPSLYAVTAAWSSSVGVEYPPFFTPTGAQITVGKPGPGQLIVEAPPGLLIVELANVTKTAPGRAERYVFFLSTRLAGLPGGAPMAEYRVVWREDVATTHPVEADPEHAGAGSCNLNWLGSVSPITLPGGGIQLVTYNSVPKIEAGVPPSPTTTGRRRLPTRYQPPHA